MQRGHRPRLRAIAPHAAHPRLRARNGPDNFASRQRSLPRRAAAKSSHFLRKTGTSRGEPAQG